MNSKPVVTFDTPLFVEEGKRAELTGIKGHPTLGDPAWVSTSAVLSVDYDEQTGSIKGFETLNTRYLKSEPTCSSGACSCEA